MQSIAKSKTPKHRKLSCNLQGWNFKKVITCESLRAKCDEGNELFATCKALESEGQTWPRAPPAQRFLFCATPLLHLLMFLGSTYRT